MHPARYPAELPAYFVRMLTDPDDMVIDPFGGSGVTGEVCERLKRRWQCIELSEEYLKGAVGRFEYGVSEKPVSNPQDESNYYRVPHPGILWNGEHGDRLLEDGGKKRPPPVPRNSTSENRKPSFEDSQSASEPLDDSAHQSWSKSPYSEMATICYVRVT